MRRRRGNSTPVEVAKGSATEPRPTVESYLRPWTLIEGLFDFGRLFPEPDWRLWLPRSRGWEDGYQRFTTKDELVTQMDLTRLGDSPEVNISVRQGIVTVKAASIQGHTQLTYQRSFGLPGEVDEESLKAKLENGTLRISAPLPESLRAREIPVEIVKSEEK